MSCDGRFGVFLLAAACAVEADSAGEPGAEAVWLVDHAQWTAVEPGDDPFDDRPDAVDCPTSSWAVEVDGDGVALEVDTGLCNYLCATQPSEVDVVAGQAIEVSWSHAALDAGAEATAEGHIALVLGEDTVLWDVVVPIPSPAETYSAEVTAEADIPAGTPVWFHVHNHGDNTWTIRELAVLPVETP